MKHSARFVVMQCHAEWLFPCPRLPQNRFDCLADSPQKPAEAILTNKGDVLMAISKYGKGTVFAVADPWIYNEYADGIKLPPEYDNYAAGKELVEWLLKQVPVSAAENRASR